jgi:hypothetical protein
MTDTTIPGVVWIPPEPESFAALKRFARDFRACGLPERAARPVEQPAETSHRCDVRRRRKPSLDKLIAKAKAAGATSVVVDGVELRFGEPGAAAVATSNPWDEVLSHDTH